MNDQELLELAALAVVGALDDDERAEVEVQLDARPQLHDEERELQLAAGTLAVAATEPPPPGLRAAILEAIRDVPQERNVEPASAARRPIPDTDPAMSPVVPISRARRRRWASAATIVAAAAAAVVGVLVVQVVRDDDAVEVADVVEAEDAVTVELGGELQGLRLVSSPQSDAIALLGDGVDAVPADQVYELWLIKDATPARVDIFRPNDDGRVELVVAGMDLPEGAAFAVTVEPDGGSSEPTGPIVASTEA